MNETEIKIVEYLTKCLKETEDAINCDNSIRYRTDMDKYDIVKRTINVIIQDITAGEYKK